MNTIELVTLIKAPIAKCFELSLSIDLEVKAASAYLLQPIGGVTSGIIKGGDRIQWRTRQFGLWITHTSEISGFDPPVFFQDRMVKGIFRSFEHNHYFRALDSEHTEMRDWLSFSMPFFALGVFSERLVRRRLLDLLAVRNQLIQRSAEGG
jgi:ligand-binding SRPBCC domain-containing protein